MTKSQILACVFTACLGASGALAAESAKPAQQFDAKGRLIAAVLPNGRECRYSYGPDGTLSPVADPECAQLAEAQAASDRASTPR